MKLSSQVLTIQQPSSPQGIQTPVMQSPSSKGTQKQILNEPIGFPKSRSVSIKVEGQVQFNSRTKENKGKKQAQQKSSKSPKHEKKLCDMTPKEITNLLKENQSLKEEILRMQSLIQEVVPVFSKITEELDEDHSIFKTNNPEDVGKKFQSRNQSSHKKGSLSSGKDMRKYEEITFLEQSLRHLKCYYDQKENQLFGAQFKQGEDSEFLEAENLDITTLDERQTCNNRIKASVLTFGNNNNSTLNDINSSPRINSQPFNYAMNIKPKLTDLNRVSKNFNMPVAVDLDGNGQKLINFEEMERLKSLIDKINNTDIMKEIRSSKQEIVIPKSPKASDTIKSRNAMLLEKDTHVITDKHLLSNDSGFSDEPSIPGDSFQKQSVNYIPTHNMKTGGPGRSVSPFNKFQITNMQQRYVESEKLLNKMPQKHEMNYPNQILAQGTKAFNSCASIESTESDNFTMSVNFNAHQPIMTIQSSVSNRIKDSFTPEKKGISPVKGETQNPLTVNITPVLSPLSSNFVVSPSRNDRGDQYLSHPSTMRRNVINDYQKQHSTKTDNEKFAHYIREVNFDKLGNRDEFSNDNIGVDYFFQSQSKDCFQFSQSQSTEQQAISKRESVDHMLWMLMKNETPIKANQAQSKVVGIRDSLAVVFNPRASDETSKMAFSHKEEQEQNQRLSSGFKRLRSANKENALSPSKRSPTQSPQIRNDQKLIEIKLSTASDARPELAEKQLSPNSPKSDAVVSKVLEESMPTQQVLCIRAELRPELEISQMTSQVTNSVAKKSNYKTNSISSAASLANGDQSKRKTRGKSLSHFNLADQVKRSINECKMSLRQYQLDAEYQNNLDTEQNEEQTPDCTNLKRSPSFQQKWMTIEDKEKNLVELNQQIILRTQESQNSRQNNNYERLIIEELLPQNNIKITQKLVQKKQQDDSLCQIDNSYISGNQTNNVVASQQSPLVKAQVDSPQILKAPLVQVLGQQQSKSMKPSPKKSRQGSNNIIELTPIKVDNSPLITLMNTSKTESESGVSSKSQQRYAKFISNAKQRQIQQDLNVLETELQKAMEDEKKSKASYLETPSPRVLNNDQILTPQFTMEQLRMMNEEVTFKLNESEVLASDNAKKEEMTSRRVSTADRREGENSSQQSALLEHHLLDFFSEQQKINKIAHDRVNSCCTKSQKILSEFETIPRGSEVEESPRELEFKMTMKPMHPVSQRETDYAPRQTPIPEEGSSAHSSIVDIKISPTKDFKELKNTIRENTVIQEQPSDEEQENSIPKVQVYAIDSTVINLVSEENSMKVSIRDVEMVDGDMFTSRGLDMMMQPDSVLGMVKETCQSVKGSDAPSNYNSSRYKTPLRQFINSGLKSQSNLASLKKVANNSQVKVLQTIDSQTDLDFKNLKTSMISSPKILSPQTEEKATPNKKPFFITKRDTHNKSGVKKDTSVARVEEQPLTENNTSRSYQASSNKDKLNKMRIDYYVDRSSIGSKCSQRKNDNCGSILAPNHNETILEPVLSSSRARSNYSSIIQKSAHATPQRTQNAKKLQPKQALSPIRQDPTHQSQSRLIPTTSMSQQEKLQRSSSKHTSKPSEIDVRLKEKEQRVKEIMQRKAQLEEQRQQIRQLKEQASLIAKKNDQKLNLSKGLYLRKQSQETITNNSTTNTNACTNYNQHMSIGGISQTTVSNITNNTPTSSMQKIVLKKEQILQSFCSGNPQQKKVYIKPEKAGNSGIFSTIEPQGQSLSQTPSVQRQPSVQTSINHIDNIIGPQTERVHSVNFKETSSPIAGLQPTLRQKEFFKKIEDDCNKRKLKHMSRLEQMNLLKQKHQADV